MTDHPPRDPADSDVISLRFVFVPDGAPIPDIARDFRDPIFLRAWFEPEPRAPSHPKLGQDGAPGSIPPGSAAHIPTVPISSRQAVPGLAVATASANTEVKLIAATGSLIAWGTAGELLAEASMVAAVEAALPVFLAVGGTVVAFYAVSALIDYLVQMSGDRNAGLPGPLRAKSERARASASAVDQAVVDELNQDEWSAHHFIGINGARQHTELLEAAARAGWHMDEPENVIALPRNFPAQEKLARAGIHRPVHDNGHPEWNADVHRELLDIEQRLRETSLDNRSEEYAVLVRQLLEALQARL